MAKSNDLSGSHELAMPLFQKKNARIVPGNMHTKFKVRKFNCFGAKGETLLNVQKQTENLSVRYHVTASAHLRHHFLVALRLALHKYL